MCSWRRPAPLCPSGPRPVQPWRCSSSPSPSPSRPGQTSEKKRSIFQWRKQLELRCVLLSDPSTFGAGGGGHGGQPTKACLESSIKGFQPRCTCTWILANSAESACQNVSRTTRRRWRTPALSAYLGNQPGTGGLYQTKVALIHIHTAGCLLVQRQGQQVTLVPTLSALS